jgi:hypothetical protein
MRTTGAAVRARHHKAVMASASRLEATKYGAIRARYGRERLAALEAAAGTAWLPVEDDVLLAGAVHDALGLHRFARFYREHFQGAFRTPLFRPIMDGALALFGSKPGLWARTIPPGWSVVFRDCGHWEIVRSLPGTVELALRDLPDACLRDDVWLGAVAASLSAMIDAARVAGGVECVAFDRASREAAFAYRWQEPVDPSA